MTCEKVRNYCVSMWCVCVHVCTVYVYVLCMSVCVCLWTFSLWQSELFCHLHYRHTTLLTGPTKITSRLPNHNVGQLGFPVSTECSIGYWLHNIWSSSCLAASNVTVPNFLETGQSIKMPTATVHIVLWSVKAEATSIVIKFKELDRICHHVGLSFTSCDKNCVIVHLYGTVELIIVF